MGLHSTGIHPWYDHGRRFSVIGHLLKRVTCVILYGQSSTTILLTKPTPTYCQYRCLIEYDRCPLHAVHSNVEIWYFLGMMERNYNFLGTLDNFLGTFDYKLQWEQRQRKLYYCIIVLVGSDFWSIWMDSVPCQIGSTSMMRRWLSVVYSNMSVVVLLTKSTSKNRHRH